MRSIARQKWQYSDALRRAVRDLTSQLFSYVRQACQGGCYVIGAVGLSLVARAFCPSFFEQDYCKSDEPISLKHGVVIAWSCQSKKMINFWR